MGFTPDAIDRMMLWQYVACVDGFRAAHGGSGRASPEGHTEDELRAMGVEGF